MRNPLLLTLTLFMYTGALAQMDAKVTTGVVHFNQGDFQKAVYNLGLAMQDPSKLKKKNRAKGWYYLGKSGISKYSEEVRVYKTGNDVPDPRIVKESIGAFQQGLKLNDEKFNDKLRLELQAGQQLLLQLGLQYLNGSLARDAMVFLGPAAELNDGVIDHPNHVANDLYGQCLLMERDSAAALAQFIKGLDLIEGTPPQQADLLCGYLGYRAALVERYANKNVDAALAMVRKGKMLTDREWNRIGDGSAKYVGDLKDAEDQHRNVMDDLQRFELDLLMNAGDRVEEAVAKLKVASEENPDDYIIQVAYASLLEKVDIPQAIAQYERAISVDGSQQMAHYNIAAIYVNQAVAISDRANNTDDLAEAESLGREVKALFELALPHMRKALAAKPDDLGALNALIQITVFLGLTDEYNTYVQQRKLLSGK